MVTFFFSFIWWEGPCPRPEAGLSWECGWDLCREEWRGKPQVGLRSESQVLLCGGHGCQGPRSLAPSLSFQISPPERQLRGGLNPQVRARSVCPLLSPTPPQSPTCTRAGTVGHSQGYLLRGEPQPQRGQNGPGLKGREYSSGEKRDQSQANRRKGENGVFPSDRRKS